MIKRYEQTQVGYLIIVSKCNFLWFQPVESHFTTMEKSSLILLCS
jgi:hypothetical protein